MVFVALLAINSYWLSIHPARVYGTSVAEVYRYLRQTVGPDDALVVSEWSGPVPPQLMDVVSTKEIAVAHSDRSARDVISLTEQEIERRITESRTVYVYALVPGVYTLRDMNRARDPDAQLSAGYYESLEYGLMARYSWEPVLSMVDARNQAAYQLGRRRETLWLVHP